MPIEINWLRDYKGGDPEKFRQYQRQRFRPVEWVDDVLAVDEKWRNGVQARQDLSKEINKIQKEVIAPKKKAKENCDADVANVSALKKQVEAIDKELPLLEAERDKLLSKLGNVVDPEVPIGEDEDTHNAVCRLQPHPPGLTLPQPVGSLRYDLPPTKPLKHDELLWRIGGFEDERGRKVAGHRGYFLTNAGVLLNQALINFGTQFLMNKSFEGDDKKYEVLQPPFFMKKELMAGIAQLEDFDEQLYKVSGKTDEEGESSDKYLIATSEQPICAYHMNEWLEEKDLPKRYAGVSTCFRKEAGSGGKDVKGIFRVHQFDKIEQFVICKDDLATSVKMQQQMLENSCEFYDLLGFPYRVVTIASAHLNDAAIKKYDLEAWFPGQGNYRELVSCSNCTDFQSRAMGIRCGAKKMGQVSASYVHMLNSTLCATGRGICCLLENYQTAEGVVVPEVLRPFMGGASFLPFVREARVEKDDKPAAKSSSSSTPAAAAAPKAPAAPAPAKETKAPAPAPAKEAKVPTPPAAAPTAAPAADPSLSPAANAHVANIVAIGNKVRDMKANKAAKEDITAALVELKNAKEAYKGETGKDYVAPGTQGNSKDKKKEKNAAAAATAAPAASAAAPASKKAPPAAKPDAAPAKANKPPPAPRAAAAAAPAAAAESGPLGALGAAALDSALLFQSYVGGYSATAEDASAYAAYSKAGVDAAAAKAAGKTNVARWLSHMASFTPSARAAWPPAGKGSGGAPVSFVPPPVAGVLPAPAKPVAAAKSAPAPKAAAAAADDDDEMDWGDDDDEDAAPKEAVVHPPGSRAAIAAEAKAKRDAETEKKKEEAMARLAKKEANQRSLCNLEIKPWEASQDLKALYAKIKETVVLDGLKWSENCALVDVAFGVQKIVCTAVIPLSLSMDAIIDEMTEDTFADEIQSMNMTSMSLL